LPGTSVWASAIRTFPPSMILKPSPWRVYSGRGYWNFYNSGAVRGFTGLEGGGIKFNTIGLKGSGYEAALFAGGEYRLSQNISLLMDFAPTLIMLRHAVYSDVEVSGVEFVINAGVYYRFGGGAPGKPAASVPPSGPARAQEKPLPKTHSVDELLDMLDSEDWKQRRQAAFELGKTRDPEVVEPLIETLTDENEKVRGVTALALGYVGDKRAFLPLLATLRDKSPYVRAAGAKALAPFRDRRALKPLIRRLKDDSEEVRKAAGETIDKIRGGDAR
jgi:hypothetical protein